MAGTPTQFRTNQIKDDAITTDKILNSNVTLAKLPDISQGSFLARYSFTTGAPEEVNATQATSLLDVATGDSGSGGVKGLVPAPGVGDATKFLRGDMTYATGDGSPAGSNTQVQFNNSGAFGADSTFTFNSSTKEVGVSSIAASSAAVQLSKFTNTASSGSTAGAGEFLVSDDGAALSSGDRLGTVSLGGSINTSHTLNYSSSVEAFTTQNWSGTAGGSNLVLSTTPNNSLTKAAVLTLGQDKSATLAGNLILNGSTSGSLTIKPPAAAGSNTLTLPAGTTNFSSTGGTSQVVKQTSAGAAFTVGQLAYADISGLPTQSGNAGLFLTTNGASLSFAAPSGVSSMNVVRLTSASGTYTPTTGMKYITVQAVGGGGQGGGTVAGVAGAAAGQGGQAGSYAYAVFSAATIGASKAYTIGLGGSFTNGADGGTTTFGSTLISCPGGKGGASMTSSANVFDATNGTSYTTLPTVSSQAGSSFVGVGQPGLQGFSNGPSFSALGGQGGAGLNGCGALPSVFVRGTSNNSAADGNNNGAGGNGAATGANATIAGGDGNPGVIIITEYI